MKLRNVDGVGGGGAGGNVGGAGGLPGGAGGAGSDTDEKFPTPARAGNSVKDIVIPFCCQLSISPCVNIFSRQYLKSEIKPDRYDCPDMSLLPRYNDVDTFGSCKLPVYVPTESVDNTPSI